MRKSGTEAVSVLKRAIGGHYQAREDKDLSLDIWRETPVGVEEFTREYMGRKKLSKKKWEVLFEIFGEYTIPNMSLGKWGKLRTKWKSEEIEPPKKYRFFKYGLVILKVGQRGGKNYLFEIVVNYACYLWVCLRDPYYFFDVDFGMAFEILSISQVSEVHASEVFYKRLTAAMLQTLDPRTGKNWYAEQGVMVGIEENKKSQSMTKQYIKIASPGSAGGIFIYRLGKEATTVEGYNMWMFVEDEPSRANTEVKYLKAKHQFNTCYSNIAGTFDPYMAMGAVFSYPEQRINDLTVELYDKYKDDPDILTIMSPTIEFNPSVDRVRLAKRYKDDPIDAARRFECIVPPSEFGFFQPHWKKIRECATLSPEQNRVQWKRTLTKRQGMIKGKAANLYFTAAEIIHIKGDTRKRVFALDPSKSRDKFVIWGGYAKPLDQSISKVTLTAKDKGTGEEVEYDVSLACRPVLDILIVWEPKPNRPVDYINVTDIMKQLIRAFPNTRAVVSDHFNDPHFIQTMLDLGVRGSESVFASSSLQLRNGKVYRHLIWNNSMDYLADESFLSEQEELLLESMTKFKLPSKGGKPNSPDLFDPASLLVMKLQEIFARGESLDLGGEEYYKAVGLIEEEDELKPDSVSPKGEIRNKKKREHKSKRKTMLTDPKAEKMAIDYEDAVIKFTKVNDRYPKTNDELAIFLSATGKRVKSMELDEWENCFEARQMNRSEDIPGMDKISQRDPFDLDQDGIDVGF